MSVNKNEACCSIPPVQSDYSPKGIYVDLGGLKSYSIGKESADKAIIVIYDIFGFWPSTQQGADLLSEGTGARVVMPDFFRGKPFPQEKFPPQSDADKEDLQSFFGGIAKPDERIPEAVKIAKELKSQGAKSVGILGFCWGGKISVLASQSGEFSGTALVHPAMLSADDAKALTVPVCFLPSKDEDASDCKDFEKVANEKPFAKQNVYHTYSDMHHGWAAARADLKDQQNKKRFHEAYEQLAAFFAKL